MKKLGSMAAAATLAFSATEKAEAATIALDKSIRVQDEVSSIVAPPQSITATSEPEVMTTTLAEVVGVRNINTIGRYDGGSFTADGNGILNRINYTGFAHQGGTVGKLINQGTIDNTFTPITFDAAGNLAQALQLNDQDLYYFLADSGSLQELSINAGDSPDDAGFINLVDTFSTRDNMDASRFSFRGSRSHAAVRLEGKSVPEPSTALLAGMAAGGTLLRRKRTDKAS